MGLGFPPSLANFYLGWWERGCNFWDGNPFRSIIKFYHRYMDVLLIVCSDTMGELNRFLLCLNDNALNLQFTGQMSNEPISFLDVTLSSRDGHITSSIYRKPNSGNTLLRADSGHPNHVTHSIPVGQFLRLRRVCSEEDDFQREKEKMSERFLIRGYNMGTLRRATYITDTTARDTLLCDRVHK